MRFGFLYNVLFAGILALAVIPKKAVRAVIPLDAETGELTLATFDMDVTPPIGSHLAYDTEMNSWDLGLRAKGIVLSGAGKPIVLCAVDWIGIANESHDAFCQALADAAGTVPERVAVHAVHQHDAPICDFSSERILKEAGLDPLSYEGTFSREIIQRLKKAVMISMKNAQRITHVGMGQAEVYQVASNRRILDIDGHVRETRWTACDDPAIRAEPEGLIDPMVSLISFWDGEKPVAVLSYYAVHPQSYYRTGVANPDFPGIARFLRQLAVPEALHIHFNGAGADVGAGKYNDGSPENRLILAERLADGMKRAWEGTVRTPVTSSSISWVYEPVSLPPAQDLKKAGTGLNKEDLVSLSNSLSKVAWLERLEKGRQINVSCLSIGDVRIVHLPGEPFVKFQLETKAINPNLFIAVAGYGDYAPGYIGTVDAYEQGGYETGPASGVAPEAGTVLMMAIRKLLKDNP
jgi:hypothetical protein